MCQLTMSMLTELQQLIKDVARTDTSVDSDETSTTCQTRWEISWAILTDALTHVWLIETCETCPGKYLLIHQILSTRCWLVLPCPLQPAQSQFFDRLRPRSRDVTDGTAGVFVGQTASSLDRKRAASFSASPATPCVVFLCWKVETQWRSNPISSWYWWQGCGHRRCGRGRIRKFHFRWQASHLVTSPK